MYWMQPSNCAKTQTHTHTHTHTDTHTHTHTHTHTQIYARALPVCCCHASQSQRGQSQSRQSEHSAASGLGAVAPAVRPAAQWDSKAYWCLPGTVVKFSERCGAGPWAGTDGEGGMGPWGIARVIHSIPLPMAADVYDQGWERVICNY